MFTPCCQYRTAIFTTLTVLGGFTLATFSTVEVFAQTPPEKSAISQCLSVKIELYIWQLNQGSPSAFNALVACNSKAVPALTRALDSEDDNLRIIAIAALGKIGTNAAPAVPKLTALLNDNSEDICLVAVNALGKIDPTGDRRTRSCLRSRQRQSNDQFTEQNGDSIRENIDTYIETKPPVMCRIPAISNLLTWKCPKKADKSYRRTQKKS
jgi:hypothetical protein